MFRIYDHNNEKFLSLGNIFWSFSDVVSGKYNHISILKPTGVKDAEGKDVFESDILVFKDGSKKYEKVVAWDHEECGFVLMDREGKAIRLNKRIANASIVIKSACDENKK